MGPAWVPWWKMCKAGTPLREVSVHAEETTKFWLACRAASSFPVKTSLKHFSPGELLSVETKLMGKGPPQWGGRCGCALLNPWGGWSWRGAQGGPGLELPGEQGGPPGTDTRLLSPLSSAPVSVSMSSFFVVVFLIEVKLMYNNTQVYDIVAHSF